MLTRVDITNTRNNTLPLTLTDSSNGYVVKDIEGLDPVKAVLTTSSMAQIDGAQLQNARRDIRNITIKLGFDPDYILTTVQSLRSNLYNWFLPEALIALKFYLDNTVFVVTSGQVESNQNSMFSSDPEVDISIICYDPDFYAPASTELDSSTVSTTDTQTISYPGTSDTGVIFTLSIDRDLDEITLYNTTPDNTLQQLTLSGTGAFISGDVLTINTIPGQKSVLLTRSGITSSVLFYLTEPATWITLENGDNKFRAYAAGAAIPYILTYTPLYGAI